MLRNKVTLIGVISLILLIGILGYFAYHFYNKYQKTSNDYKKSLLSVKDAQDQTGDIDVKTITEKVGKLIVLPDETPTVATVSDKSKLENQPFFNNAENGDRVLIFQNAKKAIIYRESTNKIIEVGTITISQETIPTISPTRTSKPTVSPTP